MENNVTAFGFLLPKTVVMSQLGLTADRVSSVANPCIYKYFYIQNEPLVPTRQILSGSEPQQQH